jgi:hypothetical protein
MIYARSMLGFSIFNIINLYFWTSNLEKTQNINKPKSWPSKDTHFIPSRNLNGQNTIEKHYITKFVFYLVLGMSDYFLALCCVVLYR